MPRLTLRTAAALALAVALLVGGSAGFTSCWPDPPPAGFIGRSGTHLTLNGNTWRGIGYNVSWIAPSCSGASSSDLDITMPDIATHSGANLVRAVVANTGSFATFDMYLSKAKANGIRIIPALTDNWGQCGDGSQKLLSYYQTGYKASYKAYAVQFANRYKNETGIAWYQLVNEPDARSSGGCDETAARNALRGFADDMTDAIKAVDPNHLVDLGAISWCGGQGSDYGYVTSGKVDLCDLHHDYDGGSVAFPSSEQREIQQCLGVSGKPGYVGEAGIGASAGNGASLQTRADQFKAKITASFTAGLSGYQVWKAVHQCSASSDPFDIGASQNTSGCSPREVDPTEAAMASIG